MNAASSMLLQSQAIFAGRKKGQNIYCTVTSPTDGMNLVIKEFVAAQDPECPGVVLTSDKEKHVYRLQNFRRSNQSTAITQRLLVITPEQAKAVMVVFTGGNGALQISPDGKLGSGKGNFLIPYSSVMAIGDFIVVAEEDII